MPLDRQRKRFKNEYNVDIAESILCDIIKHTTFWLEPVYSEYVKMIKGSKYIQADETPIPVLTRDNREKTHRGYFWVYYNPLEKIVCFDYRKNRSSDRPNEFLKDFKGILQVDCYDGYNAITSRQDVVQAGCMDHIRQDFKDALQYDKELASYVLEQIATWYEVEKSARDHRCFFDERLALRQDYVIPKMKNFIVWLDEQVHKVLPKSVIGKAVSYALNQWSTMTPYMSDGRIELSNILVENAIRPVALGRKNFLFAGSHEAAQRAAIIYSLVATLISMVLISLFI